MVKTTVVEDAAEDPPAADYRREYASSLVSQSPEVLWGRPTFAGTRVPVDALFDYLEDGENIGVFADHFGIDKEVVRRFLKELQEKLYR
ncbi:MAG: DUF433 domain-containing protein [Blastocatellia bacterium]